MNRILFTCFKGSDNSSKILIDKIKNNPNIIKLYLDNDFDKCKYQLYSYLDQNNFDYIISFGRKPIIKQLYIETNAKHDNITLKTNFDYNDFLLNLSNLKIKYKLSNNAGNYLCNHIYFSGLDYIKKNSRNEEMIFIHTPDIKNFSEIDQLVKILNEL